VPAQAITFAFILCPPKPLPLPLFCARPGHYLCLYFVPAQAITFAFILCLPKPLPLPLFYVRPSQDMDFH
jgi:hypothetical protein